MTTTKQELVAFPNPFTNLTNIKFTMQQAGKFSLALYDMRGALVTVIAEGKGEADSYLSFEVAGTNLTEGLYIARFTTTVGVKNIKVIRKR